MTVSNHLVQAQIDELKVGRPRGSGAHRNGGAEKLGSQKRAEPSSAPNAAVTDCMSIAMWTTRSLAT